MSQVKSMVLLADEREIALTDSEKQKVAEAAKEYFTSLSEEEVSALKVSQEEIQTMYEDYCLADKAYEQITGDEAVEISDDEARIIQIQQIFVPEENQAKELKNKLDNGEDFESLAANYSKASQTTITIARGDKDQTYEEVAFNLEMTKSAMSLCGQQRLLHSQMPEYLYGVRNPRQIKKKLPASEN